MIVPSQSLLLEETLIAENVLISVSSRRRLFLYLHTYFDGLGVL